MHFTTTVLTLFAAASISSAALSYPEHPKYSEESSQAYSAPSTTSDSTPISTPCSVVQEGDYIWKISEFSCRKPNGTDLSSISFNISATNNGTLDFQCGTSTEDNSVLEEGKYYSCGESSLISFAFESDGLSSTRILIKQDVSDE
jgi:hypothetical protein